MGGFSPGVIWNEDLELWFRIVLRYPVAFSWDGTALWHRDASNRVSNSLSYQDIQGRGHVVSMAMEALENRDTPPKYVPYLKEYIAKFEITRAFWHIKAGYPESGREILAETETRLFCRKKRFLLLLSYIPAPLFRLFWTTYRNMNRKLFHKQYNSHPWLKINLISIFFILLNIMAPFCFD
jgi:hypothetical protein